MRILKVGIAIFLAAMIAIACQHKTNTPVPATTDTTKHNNNNNTDTTTNTVDTSLCFSRDILPIFIANCTQSGCHNATDRAEGYVFTSYETITSRSFVKGNATATKLYKSIVTKGSSRMPQPPYPALTDAQIALIGRWINEGANNKTDCGALCDSNSYTYSGAVKPMMEKYCKGCHNVSNASGGIALDTYDGTKNAVLNGKVLASIRQQSGASAMPQGGSKLSTCQITQVQKWANAGAPNN